PPPPPATLSYSSLEDHLACGYRYYLRRVLGLPEQDPPPVPDDATGAPEAAPGLDPRVRGDLAHTLLEILPDPAAATAADVHEVALDKGAQPTEAEVEDLLQLVHAFGRTTVAARVAAAVRVRREEPFAFPLDDADPASPLVNGFIDLVAVLEDGTWLVVDYKTNQVAGADLEAVVEHGYATQRRIYALAALRAGAPRAEVVYVFLQRPDEPVTSTHAAADLPVLAAALAAQAAPLLAGRFPVAERPFRELCAACPGRGGMCSWAEAMTLRPAPEE
ncbi:MAG: family ATPase, partial [Solirubrobacterales bacterium]|nr:family ATPase [Solirubrobacterales bacterium]